MTVDQRTSVSSRRASHLVVGGLTALVAVTAILWIALTLPGLAFAFGYGVTALIIGAACAITTLGISLLRRAHPLNARIVTPEGSPTSTAKGMPSTVPADSPERTHQPQVER
jgi:hypothetical protein